METKPKHQLRLDTIELSAGVPDVIHTRAKSPTQLKLFVAWVCRIHGRCQELELARALGFTDSPWKRASIKEGTLKRACYELAVFLSRTLGLPQLDLEAAAGRFMSLARSGRQNEWRAVALNLRHHWLENPAGQPSQET